MTYDEIDPESSSSENGKEAAGAAPGQLVRRHRISTRVWHWLNVLTVFTMLMSGLMIFNAHPRLYWGQYGANPDSPFFEIGSTRESGFVRIGHMQLMTTGVLGYWQDTNGNTQRLAFPGWMTIPSTYNLAMARRWHLFFAWVLALSLLSYLLWSVSNSHVRTDLAPSRKELKPSHVWHDIKQHALLHFPTGEAALHYNILQKLAYLGLLFVMLPLIVLTGLTMSPGLDAAWPWLLDLFGGRQSARSIHFIVAFSIVLFIVVHLLMVLLAGPFNEIRSMISGKYRLPKARRS